MVKIKRYTTYKNGYKIDKAIFWGATSIIILILIYLFSIYGWTSKPYFVCNENYCKNDLLIGECTNNMGFDFLCKVDCKGEWCNQVILPRGEYGTPPPNFTGFYLIMFSLYLLAFSLNHFLYNGGKKK